MRESTASFTRSRTASTQSDSVRVVRRAASASRQYGRRTGWLRPSQVSRWPGGSLRIPSKSVEGAGVVKKVK